MSKIVNIVVDASGSMAEDDKNAVIKYLLNGICNVMGTPDFDSIEFALYQWGQESKKIENLVCRKFIAFGYRRTKTNDRRKSNIDFRQ